MHKLIEYFRDRPVIREWDEKGLLKAAGYKWTETLEWLIAFFFMCALGLALVGLACAAAGPIRAGGVELLFFGASVVCLLMALLFGTIERGLSFERDGRIRNRGGWVNWLDMFDGFREHKDIASIEITKTERGMAVAAYTTWGGTWILSDGLSEAHARLVSVQLTLALRELRESLTSMRSVQQQPQGTAQQTVWIN